MWISFKFIQVLSRNQEACCSKVLKTTLILWQEVRYVKTQLELVGWLEVVEDLCSELGRVSRLDCSCYLGQLEDTVPSNVIIGQRWHLIDTKEHTADAS